MGNGLNFIKMVLFLMKDNKKTELKLEHGSDIMKMGELGSKGYIIMG